MIYALLKDKIIYAKRQMRSAQLGCRKAKARIGFCRCLQGMRRAFTVTAAITLALVFAGGYFWRPALWSLVMLIPLVAVGVLDMTQRKQAIRRNFPLVGHGRYLL